MIFLVYLRQALVQIEVLRKSVKITCVLLACKKNLGRPPETGPGYPFQVRPPTKSTRFGLSSTIPGRSTSNINWTAFFKISLRHFYLFRRFSLLGHYIPVLGLFVVQVFHYFLFYLAQLKGAQKISVAGQNQATCLF